MRVVIGCPVAERGWVLPSWFDAIYAQETSANIEIVTLYSKSEDDTEEVLVDRGARIIYDTEPPRSTNDIDGHVWPRTKYEYMARIRNQLLDTVIEMGDVDYFFSLDSDILLPLHGLHQLIEFSKTHPGVTAPAVNMTIGATAWNTMYWNDPYYPGTAIRELGQRSDPGVDVVMAAMMLDREAIAQARWIAHDQGEDIGFCLDATQKGIPRWWAGDIQCTHVMRRQEL